mmetsp:Transcript_61101/g.180747  ORF Transcript_61101/g.180747 Transcript_61101/m.180747 type:complete len:400 (-) Transcript_61101:75-1274(-)
MESIAKAGRVPHCRSNAGLLGLPRPTIIAKVSPSGSRRTIVLSLIITAIATALPTVLSDVVPNKLAKHVLHISIDGLRPPPKLPNYKKLPNFQKLWKKGSCTMNARTDPKSSQTMPVHTSQFTGQFVKDHGMNVDGEFPKKQAPILEKLQGDNIFDLVKAGNKKACMFVSKRKFAVFQVWKGVSSLVHRNKGAQVTGEWLKQKDSCDYSFIHLKEPDSAGHSSNGSNSPEYLKGVEEADRLLGLIFDAVDLMNTIIIVTTDHGFQKDGNHGDETFHENFVIPFCVIGNGVPEGHFIYRMNKGGRQNPYDKMTSEDDAKQPIRCHDAGPLAADALGLLPPSQKSHMNNDLIVTTGSASNGPGLKCKALKTKCSSDTECCSKRCKVKEGKTSGRCKTQKNN